MTKEGFCMIDTGDYIKLAKELGFRVTNENCDTYITVYADNVIISMYDKFSNRVRVYDSDKFKISNSGILMDEGHNYEGTEFYDFEAIKVVLINIAKKIKLLRIKEKIGRIEKDF